jgi:hypothetical protein
MVDGRELRWFGHLMRMDGNRKPGEVWVWYKSWEDARQRKAKDRM